MHELVLHRVHDLTDELVDHLVALDEFLGGVAVTGQQRVRGPGDALADQREHLSEETVDLVRLGDCARPQLLLHGQRAGRRRDFLMLRLLRRGGLEYVLFVFLVHAGTSGAAAEPERHLAHATGSVRIVRPRTRGCTSVDDVESVPGPTVPEVETPHRYIGPMVIGLLLGLAVGLIMSVVCLLRSTSATAAARLAQGRLADAQATVAEQSQQLHTATDAAAAAETARAVAVTELGLVQRAQVDGAARAQEERARLTGTFAELSAEALAKNNEQFLALASTKLDEARTAAQSDLSQRQQAIEKLLHPLAESLTQYQRGLQQMEVSRQGAYEGLTAKVAQLHQGHEQLQRETRNLVTALRSPQTRGRWGEMQLRRVAEMSGMVAHCDFDEQVTTSSDDRRLRPDMVVHVPGGGEVVVDSKVPLDAFLEMLDADDDDGQGALSDPARADRAQPHRPAGQQGVLEAVRPVAADGGGVHPG